MHFIILGMKKCRVHIGFLFLITGNLFLASCSKMDASYKDFVKPNGINYVGKADSLKINSGRNRVEISWLRGTDPNATTAVIYWNNGKDSVTVPVSAGSPDDTISVIINDLPENTYTFNIFTYDKYGHSSVRVDALGSSYDSLYESKLLVRLIDEVVQDGDDAVVKWFAADATSFASEIKYTDINGDARQMVVSTGIDSTVLEDFQFGTSIYFRSMYKPDSLCIDTFYTAFDSLFVELAPRNVNLALGKAVVSPSSDCTCGPPESIVDGDKGTYWQPLGADRGDGSVSVGVDLGESVTFNEIDQYWVQGLDKISGYKIFYSDDNTSWQLAYWNASGMLEGEKALFEPVTARYIKIEAYLSSNSGIRLAELEVYDHEDAELPVNLSLNATLSDKSSDGSKGRATSLIDGDLATFWQPLSADRKDDQLVWATIDLGASMPFNTIRQNWIAGSSHIDSFVFFYSDNGTDWQKALEVNETPNEGDNISAFPSVTARYIKAQFHLASDGNLNVAEIAVYNLPK